MERVGKLYVLYIYIHIFRYTYLQTLFMCRALICIKIWSLDNLVSKEAELLTHLQLFIAKWIILPAVVIIFALALLFLPGIQWLQFHLVPYFVLFLNVIKLNGRAIIINNNQIKYPVLVMTFRMINFSSINSITIAKLKKRSDVTSC